MMPADAAAHRGRHHLGQDGAAGPDQRAGNQQQHIAQHDAGGRDRQAGEGVQQRDHDRHVGPADGQHQQEPCREAKHQQRHGPAG